METAVGMTAAAPRDNRRRELKATPARPDRHRQAGGGGTLRRRVVGELPEKRRKDNGETEAPGPRLRDRNRQMNAARPSPETKAETKATRPTGAGPECETSPEGQPQNRKHPRRPNPTHSPNQPPTTPRPAPQEPTPDPTLRPPGPPAPGPPGIRELRHSGTRNQPIPVHPDRSIAFRPRYTIDLVSAAASSPSRSSYARTSRS